MINAHPSRPPLSLLVLHSLLCQRYRVLSSVHVHSSIPAVPPQHLACLGPRHARSCARQHFQLGFTLIWKDGERESRRVGVGTDVLDEAREAYQPSDIHAFWVCVGKAVVARAQISLIYFCVVCKVSAGQV